MCLGDVCLAAAGNVVFETVRLGLGCPFGPLHDCGENGLQRNSVSPKKLFSGTSFTSCLVCHIRKQVWLSLSFLLFFIYVTFCSCLDGGGGGRVDNPRAVSMLDWLFEMNNYLAVAQLFLSVK